MTCCRRLSSQRIEQLVARATGKANDPELTVYESAISLAAAVYCVSPDYPGDGGSVGLPAKEQGSSLIWTPAIMEGMFNTDHAMYPLTE